MKYLSFIILSIFLSSHSSAQLVDLFSYKAVKNVNKEEVYDQFNLKVIYDNGYVIKSIKGDTVIFKGEKIIFYEIYANKFLIASEVDSSYIKNGLSANPSFMSRNLAYIIPIESLQANKKMYTVNFRNKIILEDFKKDYDLYKNIRFYRIKRIDLDGMRISIYNTITYKEEELILQ